MEMMKQFTQRMMHQLNEMNKKMDENMRTLRGETQSLGLDLQAGQKATVAIARDEARTVECRMAAPRGGDSEPARGGCELCRPRNGGG